ncbi:MAG: fused response regulator/phosphatase [Nitrospirae bacterium]|nr:fused response regulator/phosphatase [Nitrospirota bacterium]
MSKIPANIKVLIADDDKSIRLLCKAYLEKDGNEVILAENGQEGLRLAREHKPDLIILDIVMPVMDGYTALSELRKDVDTKEIPVIILTSVIDCEANEIKKAHEFGADDFISKPFQPAELQARVKVYSSKSIAVKAKNALEKERTADLHYAARVQKKFLTNTQETKKNLINAGLKVVLFNSPATDISGDFFFSKAMVTGKAGLFFADTCGHGVSAALMSMRILSTIDYYPAPSLHPSEFLSGINSDIYDLLSQENSFVACMYFIFNQKKFIFSNAGQPAPLLLSGEDVIELTSYGSPLGMFPEVNVQEVAFEFKQGDRLLIYTDGLIEAVNPEGIPFGTDRLINFMRINSSLSSEDMKDALVCEMQNFTSKFDDDITIIIIEKE